MSAPCLASEYMGGLMFRVENILYFYTWQVFIAVYFKDRVLRVRLILKLGSGHGQRRSVSEI